MLRSKTSCVTPCHPKGGGFNHSNAIDIMFMEMTVQLISANDLRRAAGHRTPKCLQYVRARSLSVIEQFNIEQPSTFTLLNTDIY